MKENKFTLKYDKKNPRYPYIFRLVNYNQTKTYVVHCCEKTMDRIVEEYKSIKTLNNEN